MKNFKFNLLALLVIFSIGVTSCSSDDDAGTVDSDTFIRITIDGTEYNFTNIATAESSVVTLNGNNGDGISNSGDTQVALWFPVDAEIGTFDVDDTFESTHQVSFTSDSLGFGFDFAESGTITFTQVTGEYFEGTFTATITNSDSETITLENGSFRGFTID
ncbi:hypothetical protein [Psychroserpens sp. Hel_I_66]|uniref:hypothetical protein n=1 Tax=Psychroserpens sp. Hel_I_66 TaxID=1250004 RepID=UPI0006491C3C|nr:hypothetical protein [Psychroserpens sp. Hel_I_66]